MVIFPTTSCYSRVPAPAWSSDLLQRQRHFHQTNHSTRPPLQVDPKSGRSHPLGNGYSDKDEGEGLRIRCDEWPWNSEHPPDTWEDVKAVFENDIDWLSISCWIPAHHS
jgi:hypothetical protein